MSAMPPATGSPAALDTVAEAARLRLAVTRLARQLRQTADTDLSDNSFPRQLAPSRFELYQQQRQQQPNPMQQQRSTTRTGGGNGNGSSAQ